MSEQDGTAESDEFDLPHASAWTPRLLTTFTALSLALAIASHWNPWRLLLLDEHRLLFTLAGYLGLCAFDVALWLAMRRGWLRRLVLSLLTVALGSIGLIGMLVVIAVPFAIIDDDQVARIGGVRDGSIYTTYSSFIMSGCYQFEVRDESGWLTRHREVGVCLDDEKERPSASIDDSRLTVTVSEQTCEYEVDAPAMRVEPVDPTCDVLRSPPDR